ncbi:hypothetical protein PR048_015730 [Dryococelus australis]|uniref:Ionotropic glutamate receptor C-terminal domain-containing protein n=1 Tax=Dryococelus australis TaxID=614101 RepID=A0ABQ9HHQ9_9NEOP|nr:hypothetical protein PR048_015730 [Dryococelus australis]
MPVHIPLVQPNILFKLLVNFPGQLDHQIFHPLTMRETWLDILASVCRFYAYIRWPPASHMSDLRGFVDVMLATFVGATLAQFPAVQLCQFPVWLTGITGNQTPRNRSRSTVSIVTQLAGFFVSSIYSATLMSRLAVQKRTHSYEEIASLVNSTPYIVGYRRGGSSIEMTKLQLQNLNFRNYQIEEDLSDAKERVCNENYILVEEELRPNEKLFSCSADLVSVLLGTSSLSFSLLKNSPYLGVINHQLVKMHESGHVARLRNKWIREEPPAPKERESITIMHIVPCVMSLIVGIATSTICLLIEWCLFGEDFCGRLSAGVLSELLETSPRPRIAGETIPQPLHCT